MTNQNMSSPKIEEKKFSVLGRKSSAKKVLLSFQQPHYLTKKINKQGSNEVLSFLGIHCY
jgi:hypothetical protein